MACSDSIYPDISIYWRSGQANCSMSESSLSIWLETRNTGCDRAGKETRWRLSHEPAPSPHHPGARHHANAGLGLEHVSARDPGRSDRARSRGVCELDIRCLLGVGGVFPPA